MKVIKNALIPEVIRVPRFFGVLVVGVDGSEIFRFASDGGDRGP